MPVKAFIVFITLLLAACSSAPPKERIFTITQPELDALKLAYYSDYFSFVGRDDKGAVAFAIDNNRGQDGDTWQADHFLVLYDEHQGWQEVKGNGLYDNREHLLTRIPDSDYFTFKGAPAAGMELASAANDLRLAMEPITPAMTRRKGLSEYALGSAAATLYWNGRTIHGRVIHEYLYLPAFNRLSRRYFGMFDDFHGIYATVDGAGDLYFHRQQSDFLAQLVGHEEGFVVLDGQRAELEALETDIPQRSFAWGFYRPPQRWQGRFKAAGHDYQLHLQLEAPNAIANWVIGGFIMGIVKGELIRDGKRFQVYGVGELIL